eukprot:scaffold425_cov175-Amphora_coffeaeformis.AAC.18
MAAEKSAIHTGQVACRLKIDERSPSPHAHAADCVRGEDRRTKHHCRSHIKAKVSKYTKATSGKETTAEEQQRGEHSLTLTNERTKLLIIMRVYHLLEKQTR